MKTLLNPAFLVCLVLASMNQVLEKGFRIFIPIVHSYLDDLLCFPLVFSLGLAMYRLFDPDYKLTLWHMIPTLLVYAIYFEYYLPKCSSAYTADPLDVLAYLCGMVIFDYFINENNVIRLVRTKSNNHEKTTIDRIDTRFLQSEGTGRR